MGFSEDDRIRAKNYKHNKAWEIFEDLRARNFSNQDIITYAKLQIDTYSDFARNEIYSAVIKIVGGNNEVQSTPVGSNSDQ